jgi:cytochrome P450
MSTGIATPSVFDAGLPVLQYAIDASPQSVYPQIRAAHETAPIAVGPVGPEILSYELARAALREPRFIVAPGINLMAQGVTSGPVWDKVTNNLLCLDGEEHQRLRRLVSKAFTPRATARLSDTIAAVINRLIDDVAEAGHCDIVTDIARPYPIPIICALIGAPAEDWEKFSHWTEESFKAFGFTADIAADGPDILRAWGELDDYVDDMVSQRREHLTDDLLSELIRIEDQGDRLSADELRMLVASLLMGGTDTTRNQLPACLFAMCEHPDQWALLAAEPDAAMAAVEESMRHSPAVCGAVRLATEDVEFGGFLFPAGTFIFINTYAANHDPTVFPNPERLDIRRKSPPPILTFGGGAHYCLGASLARRELADALAILAQRMPNLRRTAPAPWKSILGLSGPTTLQVAFDAS